MVVSIFFSIILILLPRCVGGSLKLKPCTYEARSSSWIPQPRRGLFYFVTTWSWNPRFLLQPPWIERLPVFRMFYSDRTFGTGASSQNCCAEPKPAQSRGLEALPDANPRASEDNAAGHDTYRTWPKSLFPTWVKCIL